MTTIKITQNDYGYDLNFTLQNSDGSAFDLTGATMKLNTQLASNAAINFSKSMVLVGIGSAGTCKYTVGNTDFASDGTYNAQIQVTTPGGKVVTFGDIQIIAAQSIPLSV